MTAIIVQPQKPFECLLLWNPRETAEQLCLIEGTLFQRVGSDEILRYFTTKGEAKAQAAPNLSAIFEHFNKVRAWGRYHNPSLTFFPILPSLFPPSLFSLTSVPPPPPDVAVLYVESAQPTLLCGQGQSAGVSDPVGLGVLPTPQLQLSHAAHLCSGARLYSQIQVSMGTCAKECRPPT